MHVITKRRLREFWQRHQRAESPLKSWHKICEDSTFKNFAELRRTFRAVDKVGRFTVFDIGGNKWRVICVVHFNTEKIYIRAVLTHEEYDKDHWKRE